MDGSLRELFHEVADLGREERQRIFAERGIAPEIRAELESLLNHDSASDESFARCISGTAQAVLRGQVPEYCGRYRLLRLLGSGGMGTVYLAERSDGEIEQQVAIKLLRADADRPAWRERFLRERQLLAYLNHPAIARLLDAGHTEDGRPYFVMEYVDGIAIDAFAQHLDVAGKLTLFLQVCDGVSHAHRHLIVHRDLKPSNILVNRSGQPKLLDFGIAKILDLSPDQTQPGERMLTPNYASPEQLRGDVQTTSTDVYSLGAVLHKLLVGRSPREQPRPSEDIAIPRDAGHVLGEALHEDPADRYPSVDALAEDVRAVLESRPIRARSAETLYRVRKFVARHRVAVTAFALAATSLTGGGFLALQQRGVAQRRLDQVTQLTNRVLLFDQAISGQQSPAGARQEIVTMSKKSLEVLSAEARSDHALALEVAEAYSRLARVQGISMDAGPAAQAEAEESLKKAERFLAPVLRSGRGGRKAIWVSARIAHDRMILEASRLRGEEVRALADAASKSLDSLLELGDLSEADAGTASELYYNIALTQKNFYRTNDALKAVESAIRTARLFRDTRLRLSLGLSLLADLRRLSGDLEGALTAIRESRAVLDGASFPTETARRSAWFTVYLREGRILGSANGLSLNRPGEAAVALRKAFDLVEEWTQNDRQDVWSRLLFASVSRVYGEVLTLHDPKAALRVYDHGRARLREVADNAEARRGEAELLAGSALALLSLNRGAEAQDRVEAAFRLLRQTGDYPTRRIAPDDASFAVLRASGDLHAANGHTRQAIAVYQELLDKIEATKLDPRGDLRHAFAISDLYGCLAAVSLRGGGADRHQRIKALRLDLWRHWDRKLPNNSAVRRQLAMASQEQQAR